MQVCAVALLASPTAHTCAFRLHRWLKARPDSPGVQRGTHAALPACRDSLFAAMPAPVGSRKPHQFYNLSSETASRVCISDKVMIRVCIIYSTITKFECRFFRVFALADCYLCSPPRLAVFSCAKQTKHAARGDKATLSNPRFGSTARHRFGFADCATAMADWRKSKKLDYSHDKKDGDEQKIVVSNLPWKTDEALLRETFIKCGKIIDIEVRNKSTIEYS